MADLVADFVFDAAVEIIPPKPPGDRAHARICLCCQRPSKWIDDDGCGICNECLAPALSFSRQLGRIAAELNTPNTTTDEISYIMELGDDYQLGAPRSAE